MQFQCALLGLTLVCSGAAQSPKSITYLRLSQPIVEQRLQTPPPSEDWSAALRKQYTKAGISASQTVEQSVSGSLQKMMMCTIVGRGDSVILVSAGLARPNNDDAASVAWASLAMLPLLAESLNGVSTESSILFIAFPSDKHHHSGPAQYVQQLSEVQRKKIKGAVEISGVGRGRTAYDVNRDNRWLLDWLATAALALRLPSPLPAFERDAVDFTDAKAFRAAGVPAITVSSLPQRIPHSFSAGYTPLNKLGLNDYYNTYQLLCVFLLDLDRVARGASPKSTITPPPATQQKVVGPVFTAGEAISIIMAQINDERSQHGSRVLLWLGIEGLQDLTCDMARNNHLDAGPFESLLKRKKLSGTVAVFSGDYPSLTPEQLQGFKVGRFQRLAIATCVVPSVDAKGPTYWIAALAYE
jgi:hypothetical protein